MNKARIETVEKSTVCEYDLNDYSITVRGNAVKGARMAMICIPCTVDGKTVAGLNVTLTGKDFDEFWENFSSDKKIAELLAKKLEVETEFECEDSIVNAAQ